MVRCCSASRRPPCSAPPRIRSRQGKLVNGLLTERPLKPPPTGQADDAREDDADPLHDLDSPFRRAALNADQRPYASRGTIPSVLTVIQWGENCPESAAPRVSKEGAPSAWTRRRRSVRTASARQDRAAWP